MSNSPKTHQMPPELLLDLPSFGEMQSLVNGLASDIVEHLFDKYILYPYQYHRAIKNICRIIDSAPLYVKCRFYIQVSKHSINDIFVYKCKL